MIHTIYAGDGTESDKAIVDAFCNDNKIICPECPGCRKRNRELLAVLNPSNDTLLLYCPDCVKVVSIVSVGRLNLEDSGD